MRNLICRFFGHTEPVIGILGYYCCDRCGFLLDPPPINPSHYTTGCIIDTKNQWIQCLDCKRKSYHPKDVEHRYCGCCHKFHPPITERD